MLEERIRIQGDIDNLQKYPKYMMKSIKVCAKFPAKAGLIDCVNARQLGSSSARLDASELNCE